MSTQKSRRRSLTPRLFCWMVHASFSLRGASKSRLAWQQTVRGSAEATNSTRCDTHHIKSPLDGGNGDVFARVADVDKAMLYRCLDQVPGDLGLVALG